MEDRRDAIDFPCSPAFVKHYADQGLTTDYPPEYYRGRELRQLREEIDRLREEVASKKRIIEHRMIIPVTPKDTKTSKFIDIEG